MKWAIREAVDVYFKAKGPLKLGARMLRAGEPILIFDTVQTSAFEVASEISYVTGGRGNARILSFEGDKTLTFNFEEALLSDEGLAILSGAELIPARNPHLPGSAGNAQTVITHYTEKYSVATNNRVDDDRTNQFPNDPSLPISEPTQRRAPRGGNLNVWLAKKPFVGQNASIYVALLDGSGEMSGAPIEINLHNPSSPTTPQNHPGGWPEIRRTSHIAKWRHGDSFIAIDSAGNPMRHRMPVTDGGFVGPIYGHPCARAGNAVFDDQVAHYVDAGSLVRNWNAAWGDPQDYIRIITATGFGANWGDATANGQNVGPEMLFDHNGNRYRAPGATTNIQAHDFMFHELPVGSYSYLLAPSGGVAQPKAFCESGQYVYKVNVPSILFQDIVHVDYYVEHRRNATQISILPDKFGPFVYVEGSSLVRRASDGMDLPVTFVIPKFKINTELNFTMASTGDASTFNFQGDAYPDFSKFDLTRRVLADIQIVDVSFTTAPADPTDYRRFKYVEGDGEYLWKDPSMPPHQNIDMADTITYEPSEGGPATRTPGIGLISTAAFNSAGTLGNNSPRGTHIITVCEDQLSTSNTGVMTNQNHLLQSAGDTLITNVTQ